MCISVAGETSEQPNGGRTADAIARKILRVREVSPGIGAGRGWCGSAVAAPPKGSGLGLLGVGERRHFMSQGVALHAPVRVAVPLGHDQLVASAWGRSPTSASCRRARRDGMNSTRAPMMNHVTRNAMASNRKLWNL